MSRLLIPPWEDKHMVEIEKIVGDCFHRPHGYWNCNQGLSQFVLVKNAIKTHEGILLQMTRQERELLSVRNASGYSMPKHYDLHSLRLFRLRRFKQQASQRCHSFLPRASMSPWHKMFHFTPRLAPDFPWLRRLYHVAVQSRQLFSLKPAGLATSQQQLGDVMRLFIETWRLRDDIQIPYLAIGIMQTEGRVRSTLIFWPVTFQISGSEQESTVRANQSFFRPHESKLCTP